MQLNSVDRRDNEPFYTLENSVPACFVCQRIKRDMKCADFLAHIQKIALYTGTR